jgi:hypothetical protein
MLAEKFAAWLCVLSGRIVAQGASICLANQDSTFRRFLPDRRSFGLSWDSPEQLLLAA